MGKPNYEIGFIAFSFVKLFLMGKTIFKQEMILLNKIFNN